MDAKKNMENFNKCLAYIREKLPQLGGRSLCIGFGDKDYRHPWLEKEYQNHVHCLRINADMWDNKDILIESIAHGVERYGFEAEEIKKWEEWFKGTGMVCPRNRHTWEEFDVVSFLLSWKDIKSRIEAEVAKYRGLDDFQV